MANERISDEELMERIRRKAAAAGDQEGPAVFTSDEVVPVTDNMVIDEIPSTDTWEEMMARARAARKAELESNAWNSVTGRDKAQFNRTG